MSITKPAGERSVWQELRTAGRHATIPFLITGIVTVLLGLLITKVLDGTGFVDADAGLDRWLEKHRTPTGETLTHLGTWLGETPTIIGLTTVTVVAFRLVYHRWRESTLLAICVSGQALIFLITTILIDRQRPPVRHLDDSPPTSSFPSGHTAASTAYYVGTALVIGWHTRHLWLRYLTVAVGVLFPLVVAGCRLYRGMHYPSDVGTSFLLGLSLLAFAAHALPIRREDRGLPADRRRAVETARVGATGRSTPSSRASA